MERPLERILLVEDDPDIQTIASLALSGIGGFWVEAAGSAAEALRVAPVFAPDLILLDVMMPGMDGPAALQALRAIPATSATPVVFMTAKIQPHEVAHYRRLGSVGVIVKPFDPATLPDRVRELWRGSAVRRPRRTRVRELDALRRQYRRDLPGSIRALEDAAATLALTRDEPALEALYHLAHRLAGSAAIHGLPAVSRAAAALEVLVIEARGTSFASSGEWLDRLKAHAASVGVAAGNSSPPPPRVSARRVRTQPQ